ncbi:MAG: hypothetical protein QHH06_13360 [Clostridiales bacterium]|jgi:hypothetical protein|nr:hypothetical protein [Eubacteriales bacterium]MDH7567429.1 hypothetical protein [Clostridiales bacterium]
MAGLLKMIGSMLIYKEPKNEENGFELLENENEGVERNTTQNAPNTGNNQTPDTQKQNNTQTRLVQ